MNQIKQYSENSPSPMFAITTSGMAIKVNSRRGIWTVLIFSALTVGAMIGVPLYGYFTTTPGSIGRYLGFSMSLVDWASPSDIIG